MGIIHLLIKLMADGTVLAVVAIGAYALMFRVPSGQRYKVYCRLVVVGLTTYLLAKLLGSIYQPMSERPFEVLGVSAGAAYLNNPGFPSDHALFATFLTLAVWFETRAKRLALIMAVLTVVMGVGRVLALVHTPLDIMGGILVGVVGAMWYLNGDGKNGS